MNKVRTVSPAQALDDAIHGIINQSLEHASENNILIITNSMAESWEDPDGNVHLVAVCPMAADWIRINRADRFPRSFSVGFIDGFDLSSPSYKWATNRLQYAYGYRVGKEYRGIFNKKPEVYG